MNNIHHTNLRKLRLEAKITQSELSIEAGVSQAYIARLEVGSLDPKLSIVNKIIEVLLRSSKTTCGEIMTHDPITVGTRDTVSSAISTMQNSNFSQLPVLRGTHLVGIITERDIIRNLQHNLNELSVQSVINSGSAPIVAEDALLESILSLFQEYQAVLIHELGRISGIITRSDVLQHAITNG